MATVYVNWGQDKVKLTWEHKKNMPPDHLITSVHGFCFYKSELLLIHIKNRGWDIPGGHMELNESPEECFTREAMEEGYVEGKCRLIGYIEVDHSENPNWNEKSAYPKVGYQAYYRMDIDHLHQFLNEHESTQRMFIDPTKVFDVHHEWHELFQEA